VTILKQLGTPTLIHQPSYSMFNRWIEGDEDSDEGEGLLDTVGELGLGLIAFSPLAQGLLTSKYLNGVPEGSRATKAPSWREGFLTDEVLGRVRALNGIAESRGQTLAQLAISWVLRDPRVTSALVGASSVAQLEDNLAALSKLDFTAEELAEIDRYAVDAGVNIWQRSSEVD
jgi:L-glyceraldehyde 3-phosphate reductase